MIWTLTYLPIREISWVRLKNIQFETYNIGSRISELRKEKRLSQVQMAHAIDISQSILPQIENNQVSVSIDVLVKISRQYHIRSEWLIYGKTEYVKMLYENDFIPHV